MAEYSFPVLEQPLSDQQWGQITEGFGSGLLCHGNEPYGITSFDNAANTAVMGGRSPRTGDGRAIVSGYFHRYNTNLVITIPAVKSTTTYRVGLTYDPTQHSSPGGPVKLTVTTDRPAGGGKVFLPIYRITRRANELLSEATIVDERAFIAPSITVKGESALPPADSVLTYTVATDFQTGEQWQMTLAGVWERTGVPGLAPLQAMSGWNVTSRGVVIQRLPGGRNDYRFEAQLARTGSSFTQGTTYETHGTLLPPVARGGRGIIYIPALVGNAFGWVALNTTTGQIQARVNSGTVTISAGKLITFSANWVA